MQMLALFTAAAAAALLIAFSAASDAVPPAVTDAAANDVAATRGVVPTDPDIGRERPWQLPSILFFFFLLLYNNCLSSFESLCCPKWFCSAISLFVLFPSPLFVLLQLLSVLVLFC